MSEYLKKIAVIRGLKQGFSADGGALSGVVKAETYAGFLKAEVSLLNFAPLNGGRYVQAITDGVRFAVFEDCKFEGECNFDISSGFAYIVCCSDGVKCSPVACAVCGQNAHLLPSLKEAVEDAERPQEQYDDEAIAESNYYESAPHEDGGAVCPPQGQTGHEPTSPPAQDGGRPCQNEAHNGAVAGEKAAPADCRDGRQSGERSNLGGAFQGGSRDEKNGENNKSVGDGKDVNVGDNNADEVNGGNNVNVGSGGNIGNGGKGDREEVKNADEPTAADRQRDKDGKKTDGRQKDDGGQSGAGGGNYYKGVEDSVEDIFAQYPAAEELEEAIPTGRWAKIEFSGGRYYVFGVVYVGGNPRYICYGVPAADGQDCPKSLAGLARYTPATGGGYWIIYQDADTGKTLGCD